MRDQKRKKERKKGRKEGRKGRKEEKKERKMILKIQIPRRLSAEEGGEDLRKDIIIEASSQQLPLRF